MGARPPGLAKPSLHENRKGRVLGFCFERPGFENPLDAITI